MPINSGLCQSGASGVLQPLTLVILLGNTHMMLFSSEVLLQSSSCKAVHTPLCWNDHLAANQITLDQPEFGLMLTWAPQNGNMLQLLFILLHYEPHYAHKKRLLPKRKSIADVPSAQLPRYTSERTLREKLVQAIQSNAGFDLSWWVSGSVLWLFRSSLLDCIHVELASCRCKYSDSPCALCDSP